MLLLPRALLLAQLPTAAALHAYGHAFSRPGDFSDAQIAAIARRFQVFTVEKSTAESAYGRNSSIAATVGTAHRIKALNPTVQILMYWNAALHYGTYECESAVEPSWLLPGPHQPYYNYSVPAFRAWWVRCAVDAVQTSGGLLDGVFLDATPKVANGDCGGPGAEQMALWEAMVGELRAALGPAAVIIDNGFYLAGRSPHCVQLAGAAAWEVTGAAYAESLASIGTGKAPPEQDLAHLVWLANASKAHPTLRLIGHGSIDPAAPATFEFGLAKYMLVASSLAEGWFLANTNYSIDGGLLSQPERAFGSTGLGCGEPQGDLLREGGEDSFLLTRQFAHGTVAVDIKGGTATIKCGSQTAPQPPLKADDDDDSSHEDDDAQQAAPPFVLDLAPAAPVKLQAFANATLSSWGGNAAKGKDGNYHLFAAAMTSGCNLGSWKSKHRHAFCLRLPSR